MLLDISVFMFFLSELGEAKRAVIFLINEKMVADK